jgi:hypothetical protein
MSSYATYIGAGVGGIAGFVLARVIGVSPTPLIRAAFCSSFIGLGYVTGYVISGQSGEAPAVSWLMEQVAKWGLSTVDAVMGVTCAIIDVLGAAFVVGSYYAVKHWSPAIATVVPSMVIWLVLAAPVV